MPAKKASKKKSAKKIAKKAARVAKSAPTEPAGTSPFGRGLFRFLEELSENNDRAWFEENKARYESEVREPALEFIRAMAPHVTQLSPHLLVSDSKAGGSLMRIHRDVRFSGDKSPYKTNVGIQFRHEQGKDVHAPGLYLHIDPKEIFLGAGMWRPASPALAAVRKSIDEDPTAWKKARDDARFRESWQIEGDSLKSVPRGYAKDHPLIDDLRRTDHIAAVRLKRSDITRTDAVPFIADLFARAKPYLAWQARALGLRF